MHNNQPNHSHLDMFHFVQFYHLYQQNSQAKLTRDKIALETHALYLMTKLTSGNIFLHKFITFITSPDSSMNMQTCCNLHLYYGHKISVIGCGIYISRIPKIIQLFGGILYSDSDDYAFQYFSFFVTQFAWSPQKLRGSPNVV